jgi:hypothetical protein
VNRKDNAMPIPLGDFKSRREQLIAWAETWLSCLRRRRRKFGYVTDKELAQLLDEIIDDCKALARTIRNESPK